MPRHRLTNDIETLAESQKWNHNIHYHPVLLALGPAQKALDVGCGSGLLTRQLAAISDDVIGIDLDQVSIQKARHHTDQHNVRYIVDDILSHPFEVESFDLVVSVAALHHLDAASGLKRLADLLKPGGHLGIVGIARSRFPRDLVWQIAAAMTTRYLQHIGNKTLWHHSAPVVWPPPVTYRDMKALSSSLLPNSVFRRRLLWRYTLIWTKLKS